MRNQNHTFFYLVAGVGPIENFLSRSFQACFANSIWFRQIALKTIWKSCSFLGSVPIADHWKCDYQPSTTVAGGGYPDLCLRPPPGSKLQTPIFLESKVDSPLTELQIRKYKKHDVKILIVVTKNRPEVKERKLKQLRVEAMRWQDLCRALRQTAITGAKEQFICKSFAEYLEESGMAYREDLTKKHVDDIGVMLRKIATPKYVSTGLEFNHAHNCIQLLRDVQASVLEVRPKLGKWTAWGPAYAHNTEEGWHELGFGFTPKTWRKGALYFDAGFYFYDDGYVEWCIYTGKHKLDTDDRDPHTIHSVSSTIKGSGKTVRALDAEKLARTVIKAARKWHIG